LYVFSVLHETIPIAINKQIIFFIINSVSSYSKERFV
jgi:hypothetical protein